MIDSKKVKKYFQYVFDNRGFVVNDEIDQASDHAYRAACEIRGKDYEPSIIIHGIMKRSGTVYVGELLSLHPQMFGYPNNIWEIPFLAQTGSILDLQDQFFLDYQQNIGKIGQADFLPIFGASFIRYLYSLVPYGKRLLLKVPSVQYLNYFYTLFPKENLLVLVRDGRDVVSSTIKTWPQIRFSDACRRWDCSAKMILACDKQYANREGYFLAHYEDTVREPEKFMEQACQKFNLDADKYPYEQIKTLPVLGSSSTLKEGKGWVKKTNNFKPIGRWKQWSSWRKMVFKRIAGRSLMDLGYCDNLDW